MCARIGGRWGLGVGVDARLARHATASGGRVIRSGAAWVAVATITGCKAGTLLETIDRDQAIAQLAPEVDADTDADADSDADGDADSDADGDPRPGGCLTVTGDLDRMLAGDAGLPVGAEARTVEAWMRTTSSAEQYAVAWGTAAASEGFYVGTLGGNLVVTQYGASVQSVSLVADGQWHHVAVAFDGIVAALYVDGVFEGGGSLLVDTVLGEGLTVGATMGGVRSPFVGDLDEVAIWSYARDGNGVPADMDALDLAAPGLLVAYTFDGVSGTGGSLAVPDDSAGGAYPAITEGDGDSPILGACP